MLSIEPFFLFRTQRVLIIESLKRLLYRGSKYIALIEPFKVLYNLFF